MLDHRIEKATELIKAGEMEPARELLESLMKEDRHNIAVWRWYAETWPNPRDRMRVWEICIRNNPTSQEAQDALNVLKGKPAGIVRPVMQMETSGKKTTTPRSWLLIFWGGLGLFAVGVLASILMLINNLPKDAAEYKHTQPVEYYLYVPKAYAADRDWPLFVGIHGSGGTGLDCWNLWQSHAEKEGFVLLCPSIPDAGGGFYQNVGEDTVWSAIKEVRKQYRVSNRFFLSGVSAGAFFIQGFTYHYPQSVSGLSILSSGYFIDLPPQAAKIPILIVIGGSDNPISIQGSKDFFAYHKQYGFDIQYEELPGVGHRVTSKGINLTLALFRQTIDE